MSFGNLNYMIEKTIKILEHNIGKKGSTNLLGLSIIKKQIYHDLQKEFADIEKRIADLKVKITEAEQHFLDTSLMQNNLKAQEHNAGYELLKKELIQFEADYEKLFEAIIGQTQDLTLI
jgi:hypothetical protein